VTLLPSRWPNGNATLISFPRVFAKPATDLQLGHQRLQRVQEFASGVMRRRLLVKLPFKGSKQLVELLRLDHGPRNDLQFSCMQTTNKISILFVLNYLLEFERESGFR